MELTKESLAAFLNRPVESIDDAKFKQALRQYNISKNGTTNDLYNELKRGAYQSAGAAATGLGFPETGASLIQKSTEVPVDPDLQDRLQSITDPSNTPGETAKKLITDPKATGALIAQSLPTGIASGVGYLGAGKLVRPVAGAAGAVAAGMGAAGGISGLAEYGSTVLQTLSEAGVDIRNGEQIKLVMEDPEISAWLRKKGLERGVPIGAFDGVAFGVAGRFLSSAKTGVGGSLAEIGVQGSLGAAGEATAQVAEKGRVYNPNAPVIEFALEGAMGLPEAVFRAGIDYKRQRKEYAGPLSKEPVTFEDAPVEEPEVASNLEADNVPGTLLDKNKKKVVSIDAGTEPGGVASMVKEALPAPKEIRRGTYEQSLGRLKRLNRDVLTERARNSKSMDEVTMAEASKTDIAKSILSKYNIVDTTKKVQTPSVQEVPKAIQQPKTQEDLTTALEDDSLRNALETISAGEGRTAEAAKAWLNLKPKQKAPDVASVALPKFDKKLGAPKPRYNYGQKSFGLEFNNDVDKALYIAAQTKKSSRDSDFRDFVKTNTGMDDAQLDAAAKQVRGSIKQIAAKANPEQTPVLKVPAYYKAAAQAPIVNAAMNETTQEQGQPEQAKPASPARRSESLLPRSALPAKESVPVEEQPKWEYLTAFRKTEDTITEFLKTNPNWEEDKIDYKKASNMSLFAAIGRQYDVFRSMQSLARKYPKIAELNILWRDKQAFRHNISQASFRDLSIVAKRFGKQRLDAALEVLDIMSRPGIEAQSIKPQDDGRIVFTNIEGKRKLVDKNTSDAILALSAINKKMMMAHMQTIMADLTNYGIDAMNGTRESVINKLNEYKNLNENDKVKAIESSLTTLDKLNDLINSDKAYYPHVRSDGPYAIPVYKQGEDGDMELAGLYDVRATTLGGVDKTHLKQVRDKIRNDMARYKVEFYNSRGASIESAEPFYKSKNTLMGIVMRNAKDTQLAYETVASLLATKGVDPNVVNEMFDSLSLRENVERSFVNLRERKGYYGYNDEDRVSTLANSLLTQSSLLANYRYNPRMKKANAEIQDVANKAAWGDNIGKLADKYYGYISSPGEDANWIRSLNFWYFLAGNPSTATLQLMATFTNTLPWLGQYVSPVEFVKLNAKSLTNMATVGRMYANRFSLTKQTLDEFARRSRIGIEDAKIILQLKNEGTLDPGYGIEAVGDTEVSSFGAIPRVGASRSRIPRVIRPVAKTMSNLITIPEELARMNTALLVIDSLKSEANFNKIGKILMDSDPLFRKVVNGKYGGTITKEAVVRHAIDENHAVFGKVGRAEFMRGTLGTAAFPFLTYPIQMMEQLGRLLVDRGPEGRRAFALMMLVYPALFGGALAVPGFELWDWMTKWYKRIAEKENTDLELVISRALKDIGVDDTSMRRMILSGPVGAGVLEANLSNRIAPQFWFQPLLDFVLPPKDGMGGRDAAYSMLGGFGSFITGAKGAATQIKEGDNPVEAILKNIGPFSPVRNILKGYDLAEGDLENLRGQRLLPRGDESGLNIGDAAMKAVGMQPLREMEARRYRYGQQMMNDAYKPARASYNSRISSSFAEALHAKQQNDLVSYKKNMDNTRKILKEYIIFNQNLAQEDRKPLEELLKDIEKIVKQKVVEDAAPLRLRKGIDKDRSSAADVEALSLPSLLGRTQDK